MVIQMHYIREDDKEVDYKKSYDGEPNLFSLKLHHGGHFTKFPGRRYVKGKVNYVDLVDIDLFCAHDIGDLMVELGYSKGQKMYYHFMVPEFDLDFGLQALANDADVLKLSKYVSMHKEICVYIEHECTKVHTYFASPSKVTIREIDECHVVCSMKPCIPKKLMLEWKNGSDNEPIIVENEPNVVEKEPNVVLPTVEEQVEAPILGTPHVVENQPNLTSQNFSIDFDDFFDFDPFNQNDYELFDQIVEKGKNIVDECDNDGESEDNDYLFDDDNLADEVEVDMSDFKLQTDKDIETTHVGENVSETGDVINNDDLASDSDSDVPICKSKYLQELGKETRKVAENEPYKSNFYVGQTFGSCKEAKEMVNLHSIECRRELKIVKNDKERLRVVCDGKMPSFNEDEVSGKETDSNSRGKGTNSNSCGVRASGKGPKVKNVGGRGKKTNPNQYMCPWVLLVSKLKNSETWMVNTFQNEHKCLQSRSIRACTSKYLSKQIVDQLQSNPEIPIRAIQDQMQKKLEVGISKMKAFRAKVYAKGQLMGDYIEQYAFLSNYMHELMDKNPGTTMRLEVEEENNPNVETRVFKRIYVYLGALKKGFKACGRDLLGLDEAIMKGPFPGQVLTDVGVDPNNGIYPVAYAIVEAETKNSWSWFLSCVTEDLDLGHNRNFTIISDRQKGIVQAVESVLACAEHRFCVRHIHENMKQKWRGQAYKNMLWKCATACTRQKFKKSVDDVKKFNNEAFLWLAKIPPKHWSRSHFSDIAVRAKTDVLLNNLCEVFNKQLVDARDKPIIHALEYIREYLMKRIVNVLGVIDRTDGPLTPAATKLLESIKKEASRYSMIWNGEDKYQVTGPWGDQCVVDLKVKDCTCRKWELTGIPCKHAVASIWNATLNGQDVGLPEFWVSPVYRLDTWKHVYSYKVNPCNGMSMWYKTSVPTKLLPPKHHNQAGRPKKKRTRGANEEVSTQPKVKGMKFSTKCSKCGTYGHNKKSCKENKGGGQAGGSGSQAGGSSTPHV